MNTLFADRIQQAKPSFVREILKAVSDPNLISFAGGLPHPDSFPFNELETASQQIFAAQEPNVFQYSITEGDTALRDYLIKRYNDKFQLDLTLDNLIITTGSQQGLDLLTKLFINKGERVVMEDPGYHGASQVFTMYESELRGVPLVNNALDVDKLAELMPDAKLFYTVPNFQNPTGFATSHEQKRKIADIVAKNNAYLIEDDPYGELSFEEGLDRTCYHALIPDNSILLGSFSKIISPGLRVGWMIGPKEVISAAATAKQSTDLHTCYIAQKMLWNYLDSNNLDTHIEQIRAQYKSQRDSLLTALRANEALKDITFHTPQGGMFIWAELPKDLSSEAMLPFALKNHVVYVPGNVFSVESNASHALRLSFSYLSKEQLTEGVARLAEAYRTYRATR